VVSSKIRNNKLFLNHIFKAKQKEAGRLKRKRRAMNDPQKEILSRLCLSDKNGNSGDCPVTKVAQFI
jgi:hypothetical protein